MLTQAEHDYRLGKVTGSLITQIMNAKTETALVTIWRLKVGLDEPPPPNWPMKLGGCPQVEALILDERELQTGHAITRRGEIIDHPSIRNICVKLDGFRAISQEVVEVKVTGCYRQREDIYQYYYPQVALQMACTGTQRGVLVVAQGTADPYEIDCARNEAYEAVLLERACAFLLCIQTLNPPCILPPVIPPDQWVTVDVLEEETNWGPQLIENLVEYERTAAAAVAHDEAAAAARALVPEHVGRVLAGRYTINRDRRGRLAITSRSSKR